MPYEKPEILATVETSAVLAEAFGAHSNIGTSEHEGNDNIQFGNN